MSTTTEQPPTVDQFITLFLCALVLRGKIAIWIRTAQAHEERQRMHALYAFVSAECDSLGREDREYLHFMLRLRNQLAPGPIGAFDGLRGLLLGKMATIVSVDLMYCHTYTIDIGATTARSLLTHAEPRLVKLAESAADAYMAKLA